MSPPSLAAVVCALDEADEIEGCVDSALQAMEGLGQDCSVVVVDGGSTDGTAERVRRPARLLRTARGRAHQLNAGAAATASDALVFLHADCRLPASAGRAIADVLRDDAIVGGGFHKRWRGGDARLARGARRRTVAWHRAGWIFGDQALFVRRQAFEALGGFDESADCEDLDLALRLRKHGRLALLPDEVLVSARRIEREGLLRTWTQWWLRGLRQGARTVLQPRVGDLERARRAPE